MNNKIKIGLIFGGMSPEHEISIISAKSVYEHLDKEKYKVYSYYIDKNGFWSEVKSPEKLEERKSNPAPFIAFKGVSPFIEVVDIFFPVLHGPYGEDGTVQGIFESLKIPFVGTGVVGAAVTMDKVLTKKILEADGIPVADYLILWKNNDILEEPQRIKDSVYEALKFPVFVKPSSSGSSIGITKVKEPAALPSAIKKAFEYSEKILIEESIEGAREIEVSVFSDKSGIRVSIPGEVIPFNEFYDYEDKYELGKTKFEIPAKLPEKLVKKIQKTAHDSFKILELYGMSRVDFLLDKDNNFYVNEVNAIPGFTSISMYPRLWKESGIGYSELLDLLIQSGLQRYE